MAHPACPHGRRALLHASRKHQGSDASTSASTLAWSTHGEGSIAGMHHLLSRPACGRHLRAGAAGAGGAGERAHHAGPQAARAAKALEGARRAAGGVRPRQPARRRRGGAGGRRAAHGRARGRGAPRGGVRLQRGHGAPGAGAGAVHAPAPGPSHAPASPESGMSGAGRTCMGMACACSESVAGQRDGRVGGGCALRRPHAALCAAHAAIASPLASFPSPLLLDRELPRRRGPQADECGLPRARR